MKIAQVLTAVGLLGLSTALVTTSAQAAGGDVLLSGINNGVATFGPVGGVYAYIIGSNTCNIGDQNIAWSSGGTPALAMNAYRLHNGRLEQIGVGMMKTACCAFQGSGCGIPCIPSSGLGGGCQDTYDAGWNSLQSALKPRKNVNAYTGAFFGTTGVSGTAVTGRTQVQQADMSTVTYPGALFFLEGQYLCTEDALNGNWVNNASYTRVTMNASFMASPAGGVEAGKPAINAWRDHGLGIGVVDPSVILQNVDVPGEGRFIVASKITEVPPGSGNWHYEYAIRNFNSDRCASSFRVPLPTGASVSNTGFHDVWYHGDDAVFDGMDWPVANSGYELRWSTTQTHAQNVNANAIRWSTMYNFWFDCNRPPVAGQAEIDLFKPAVGCQSVKVAFNINVPGVACAADIVRNGIVDGNDLLSVISTWGGCTCSMNCPANVDTSGGNTSVDVNDLLKVITTWGGCP